MSTRPPPAVHGLEAEALEAVWELEEASVRDVMEALNRAAEPPRAYTTYMTTLARLHGKGLLARRREATPALSRPVPTRPEYAVLRAASEGAELVDPFGAVALSHFAR